MIIALLVLIIFIMLFGAAAVKGFLANAATLVIAVIVLFGLLIWVGSFFGPDGFQYVILGALGLLILLAIWVGTTEPARGKGDNSQASNRSPNDRYFSSQAPSKIERKRLREGHRIGPRGGDRRN